MCLCSFMAAEYDDLPEPVKKEIRTFTDINVAWLSKVLAAVTALSLDEERTACARHLRRHHRRSADGKKPRGCLAL